MNVWYLNCFHYILVHCNLNSCFKMRCRSEYIYFNKQQIRERYIRENKKLRNINKDWKTYIIYTYVNVKKDHYTIKKFTKHLTQILNYNIWNLPLL